MYVFMDESGTGDLTGSQSYFALSAVAFPTVQIRDGIEEALKQLRQEWGRNTAFEVKFARLNHNMRTQFFVKLGDLPFKHSSCVLEKHRLGGQWRDKRYLYERVIREVVGGLRR